MTLIAVVGAKGSPGVTTTAVLLAAVWPHQACLAECDPAGGDLPSWLPAGDGTPLRPDVGVVSLAAATRHSHQPELPEHLQIAAGGLPILVGAGSRRQHQALAEASADLAHVLSTTDWAVLADCGRLDDDQQSALLLNTADLVLLVCRPNVSSVIHARHALRALQPIGGATQPAPAIGVVVLGNTAAARDVERTLTGSDAPHTGPAGPAAMSAPFVASLAFDPTAARGIAGQWTRRLDRSPLVTSARLLARRLDELLSTPATGPHSPSDIPERGPTDAPSAQDRPGPTQPASDPAGAAVGVSVLAGPGVAGGTLPVETGALR